VIKPVNVLNPLFPDERGKREFPTMVEVVTARHPLYTSMNDCNSENLSCHEVERANVYCWWQNIYLF